MSQRERMLAGLPYKAWMDGLPEERQKAKLKTFSYNKLNPRRSRAKDRIIRSIVGKAGKEITVEQPFQCDYGYNIEIGDNFFANYNLIILDVARVIIGDNVQIAPNVTILTAGHPIHHQSRNSGYEYGIEVRIGDNVWLGSNVVVTPGTNIGDNSVIGAGSIVTKDIPPNVIAVGNPCTVMREITEEDRKYYFKKRPFDVSNY